ncbi:hypothetical protein SUGI_0709280 [Cryptomeria japonica]|nr:hypothetical protein SUGI_0709280 [Cryptomeria japonica]
MTSKNRRVTVFKRIDKMLKNEENLPDSDLNRIIEAIDDLLFREKENTEIQSKKEKINCEEEKMDLKIKFSYNTTPFWNLSRLKN